jgi:hypothetical protein
MRVRGLNEVKVKPIVKVVVHAPIFYFPKNITCTLEKLVFEDKQVSSEIKG